MSFGHRPDSFVSYRARYLLIGALSLVAGCGAPPHSLGASAEEVATSSVEDRAGSPSSAPVPDTSTSGNALSRAEVRLVLKLIDDTCGDTWCEGDYDYRFRNLFCDAGAQTCFLFFQMGLRDDKGSAAQWNWRTCRTSDFLGFDSLVARSSNGYQWLADGYYQALTACIGQLEN